MKTSTTLRRVHGALHITLSLCAACSDITTDQVEDLGATTSSNLDVETPPTEPFYASYSDFYGTWIGEARDTLAFGASPASAPVYHFPSGSSQIVLTLGANPDGNPVPYGTITFGAGAPPPPPTPGDTTYPSGFSYVDELYYDKANPDPIAAITDQEPLPLFEGFAYEVMSYSLSGEGDEIGLLGDVADGILRVFLNSNEILTPWCELQTPVLGKDGNYRCVAMLDQYAWDEAANANSCLVEELDDESACPPNVWSLPDEEFRAVYDACAVQGESIAVDCNQIYLCGLQQGSPVGRCECNSKRCFLGSQGLGENIHLRRHGDGLSAVIESALFFNERGLRVPLGPVTFHRAE